MNGRPKITLKSARRLTLSPLLAQVLILTLFLNAQAVSTCGRGCEICNTQHNFCRQCGPNYFHNILNLESKLCQYVPKVRRLPGCKYYLDEKRCMVCHQGYRMKNFSCEKCNVENCRVCNRSVHECQSCLSGFNVKDVMNVKKKSIIDILITKTSNVNICEKTCTTKNCHSCDTWFCKKCNQGFRIKETYTYDVSIRKLIRNTECVACSDPNCLSCDSNIAVCDFSPTHKTCNILHYYDEGKCKDCEIGCKMCTRRGNCIACDIGRGYFNENTGACQRIGFTEEAKEDKIAALNAKSINLMIAIYLVTLGTLALVF